MDRFTIDSLDSIECVVLPDGRSIPIVGRTNDGQIVLPICGAQNDGGASGAGEGDGEEGDEEEEEGDEEEEKEEEDKDGKDGGTKNPQARIAALESQLQRRVKKQKKLEKQIVDLQRQMHEAQNKTKEPDQKVEEERDSLRTEVESLKKTVSKQRLDLLILDHEDLAGLSKRRRRAIAKLAEDELEIDEDDGTNNLDEILEGLKHDEPDLFGITEEDDSDGEETEGSEDGAKKKKGGKSVKKGKRDKELADATLAQRFPALRGRVKL